MDDYNPELSELEEIFRKYKTDEEEKLKELQKVADEAIKAMKKLYEKIEEYRRK